MKEATQHRPENSFSELAGGAPHSIEAEQGLLGAILINNEAYVFLTLIKSQDLFEPIHLRIYSLAGDLIYMDAEVEARRAKRGVWQGDFIEPEEWRHRR